MDELEAIGPAGAFRVDPEDLPSLAEALLVGFIQVDLLLLEVVCSRAQVECLLHTFVDYLVISGVPDLYFLFQHRK